MKISINNLFLSCLFMLGLLACEKEEDRAILQPGTAPVLSITENEVVLLRENAEAEAVRFDWTESDFGFDAAVQYTLQIDTAGDSFASPYEFALGSSNEFTFTVEELNEILVEAGYTPEEAHEVNMRLKADVSDKVDPVYSNVITATFTPYPTVLQLPSIYVPGAYQGWDPSTAPALVSPEDNGIYSGLISFVEAEDLNFKFTAERDWDLAYGEGAEPGTLSSDNAPNLTVDTTDTYMLTADLNTLTWTAEQHSWGLVGDATGSWEVDQNLIFDNEEGVWKITTELVPGAVKFRFNDDWALNYGDNDTSNNALDAGGENIAIDEAGSYELILDLTDEENPVYSISKL